MSLQATVSFLYPLKTAKNMWVNPNKAPPSGFSKNMISRDWVTSLLKI